MTMSSCVLVGESALLMQCAALLRRRGFQVDAVLSEDPAVQAWAEGAGVRLCRRLRDAEAFLEGHRYDWLFSIVNPYVLSPRVLACAEKGAVNYHDSLLPRYSGSHAVPWALIHGETQVGVSWHLMGERADAGDLLAQSVVAVSNVETAQALNGKCAFAAIATFGKVIKLLGDPLQPVRQEAAERSFFYRFRRPTPASIVDFRRPAEDVERFVRALTFGPQLNPLGLPKVLVDGHVHVVDRVEVLAGERSGGAAGKLVDRTSEHLRITTLSDDVRLFVRPSCGVVGPLQRDSVQPDPEEWVALEAFDRSVFKHERHWLNLFRDDPWRLGLRAAERRPRRWLCTHDVSRSLAACVRILRALATAVPGTKIGLWAPAGASVPTGTATALYASTVPLLRPGQDLTEDAEERALAASLSQSTSSGTYLRDLEDRLLATMSPEAIHVAQLGVELRLDAPSEPPRESPFALCIGRGGGQTLWLAAYDDRIAEQALREAMLGSEVHGAR
jgi:methionyl-tRNA formyltransferase